MGKYAIYTDSCSDLSKEIRQERDIKYFRMNVVVAGEEHHADLDWEEYSPEQLYAWVGNTKNHCKTTMVPAPEFEAKLRAELEQGNDVIYISCSSKLSGSLNVYLLLAESLKEEFPDRKIIGVDSCCACMGEGMIVLMAADLRDQGKSIEEVADIVNEKKEYFNQAASVETLSYLKEAGRVSGASAFFGNMMQVKPILISDVPGHNLVVNKVKGNKAARQAILDLTLQKIHVAECKEVWVGQGMAQETQKWLVEKIKEAIPEANIHEFWIGPIIGTSCGPGVFATYVYGEEVTIVGKDANEK